MRHKVLLLQLKKDTLIFKTNNNSIFSHLPLHLTLGTLLILCGITSAMQYHNILALHPLVYFKH